MYKNKYKYNKWWIKVQNRYELKYTKVSKIQILSYLNFSKKVFVGWYGNFLSFFIIRYSPIKRDMNFDQLPDDIIILILSFGNEIKYRRGKLINQILENDPRREVLKRIARPFMLPNFLYEYVNNDVHYINKWTDLKYFK